MALKSVTAARLRELLKYDPETGVFVSLTNRGRNTTEGRIAGGRRPNGYLVIRLDGVQHRAHRLAWLYMTGEWPEHEIDHINGDRADNRFANLRDVTRTVNQQNLRVAHRSSKSGLIGAWKRRNRWMAAIRVDGKQICVGQFDTPEEAHSAYLAAKRRLHAGNTI